LCKYLYNTVYAISTIHYTVLNISEIYRETVNKALILQKEIKFILLLKIMRGVCLKIVLFGFRKVNFLEIKLF